MASSSKMRLRMINKRIIMLTLLRRTHPTKRRVSLDMEEREGIRAVRATSLTTMRTQTRNPSR